MFLVASFENLAPAQVHFEGHWDSNFHPILLPVNYGREMSMGQRDLPITKMQISDNSLLLVVGGMQWITTAASLSSTSSMTGREQMALLQKHCPIPRARQLKQNEAMFG